MALMNDTEKVSGAAFLVDNRGNESENNQSDLGSWRFWQKRISKPEIIYFCQIFIIYIIIISCIVNLTLTKDEDKVFITLLSWCLGYLLPNPSIKHT